MKAAVMYGPGEVPHFEDFAEPVPQQDEALVQVKAAALSNLARAVASGSHYTSDQLYPAVCGVDGVGLLEDGTRVYTGNSRHPYGTMAQRTVVSRHFLVPVPEELDDATAAALPNAAMASWLALVYRAHIQQGENVLVLGATGSAGRLAVEVARALGADHVVATGRNEAVFPTLKKRGADEVISLRLSDHDLSAAFHKEVEQRPFDIVLDFLWGHPASVLLPVLAHQGAHRTRYVSIGSMAGRNIELPSGLLRGSGLELYGSGLGSVPRNDIVKIFPQVFQFAVEGKLHIDAEALPLSEIEKNWHRKDTIHRLVFVP